MKKVLLTGATGFVGRQTVPCLLASGYEVHALSSHKHEGASPPAMRWHEVDLLEEGEEVATLVRSVQPTHLLHLAWYAVPGTYWTSSENLRWVRASLALLQAFAESGGQRVVAAGTCAEYDWRYGYCTEAYTPLAPATLYGSCKHALRLMLEAFARQAGLSAAWGRPFFLFGPHEHPERLIASVINSLLCGEAARCTHGNQVRDFLHVADAAAAFVALLDSEVEGAVNVASGQPVVLKDLIRRIAKKMGRQEQIELGVVPTPPDEPPLLVGDTHRLLGEVGWSPHYDLDAGLDDTIEWWRNRRTETEALE
jgi:nucleoside-diphosphate-sugar epimerase